MGIIVRVTPSSSSHEVTHHYPGFGGEVGVDKAKKAMLENLEALAAELTEELESVSPVPLDSKTILEEFKSAMRRVRGRREDLKAMATSLCPDGDDEGCTLIPNGAPDGRDKLICECNDGTIVESVASENHWEDVPVGASIAVLDPGDLAELMDALDGSEEESSDAKSSDTKSSDAKTTDAKTTDAKTTDAKATDAKTSEDEGSDAEGSEDVSPEEEARRRRVIEEFAEAFFSVHPDVDTHTCRYEIRVADGLDAKLVQGLCLVWAPTRTRIWQTSRVDAPVQNGQWAQQATLPPSSGNVRFVYLGPFLGPAATFEVVFSGDPPVLRGATWLVQSGVSDPIVWPFVSVPEKYHVEDAEDLQLFETDRESELSLRYRWIRAEESDRTPSQEAHAMMLAIDENSLIAPSPEVEAAQYRVSSMLASRFQIRGLRFALKESETEHVDEIPYEDWAEAPSVPGVGEPTRGELHALAVHLRSWFQDAPSGTRTLSQIAKNFGLFASGRATAFSGHGCPNGVNMFSFTEAAILFARHAAELAIDPATGESVVDAEDLARFWADMRWICAAGCEMFVHCFYGGPKRALCAYRPENNLVTNTRSSGLSEVDVLPARYFDDAQVESILARWQGFADAGNLESMFGHLVYGAIHVTLDTMHGAVPEDTDRSLPPLAISPIVAPA